MIQTIIRMASITDVPHLFSMKHFWKRIQLHRKEEKIGFEQSSCRHKIKLIKIMCLIDNSKY